MEFEIRKRSNGRKWFERNDTTDRRRENGADFGTFSAVYSRRPANRKRRRWFDTKVRCNRLRIPCDENKNSKNNWSFWTATSKFSLLGLDPFCLLRTTKKVVSRRKKTVFDRFGSIRYQLSWNLKFGNVFAPSWEKFNETFWFFVRESIDRRIFVFFPVFFTANTVQNRKIRQIVLILTVRSERFWEKMYKKRFEILSNFQ